MAIDIICDDCGSKYRVNDDKAGAKVRCKECGSRIDVPNEHSDFAPPMLTRSGSSGRKKRKGGSGGAPTGAIIGVGAIVAVMAIGIVVYSMQGRGGGPAPQMAQNNPPAALPNANPAGGGGFPQANPSPAATPASTLPATPTNALPVTPGAAPAAALPSSAQPASALPSSTPKTKTPPPIPFPGGGFPGMGAEPGNRFAGFAGAAEKAPLNWDVKVDPSKSDTTIDTAKPIAIKLPKGASNSEVLYPDSPSVFVALGSNWANQSVREIWNLSTRTKTGTITGKLIHTLSDAALSPDGQYIAANIILEQKNGVRVWATKNNKPLGELETVSGVTEVLFSSPSRLIGICNNSTAKVWKIPSGEAEYELPIGLSTKKNAMAVSPGCNYLAVAVDTSTLKVFDLRTGKVAGELNIPASDYVFSGGPSAMAFSPDGLELAMILNPRVNEKTFAIFNIADGKLLTKVELSNKRTSLSMDRIQGNRLQWFPDRSKLLWLGHYILDAKIGGPVWSAPEESGSSDGPRKLLDDKQILVAVGGRQNPRLATAPIPLKEIEAATSVVAEGGEISDVGMPKLMATDVSNFTRVATTAKVAWTMKPDPAPAGKPVKNAIPLPAKAPSIGGLFISRPADGKATVWYTDDDITVMKARGLLRHQGGVPVGGSGTSFIEVYDLVTGKNQSSLPIPYPSAVLDVSPNAECLAVKTTKPNEERIDVYSLRDGKPIAGWKPYQNQQEDGYDKNVSSALLLDNQFCLTESSTGTSYMWKLPECKAVWQLHEASNLQLSPGGKYLGFQNWGRYIFMDPRTGDLVGEVSVEMGNIHCAFHPAGTHFALLGSDAASNKIVVIDIATGQPTADFFVATGYGSIQWCGDRHLLLGGASLVDLKQKKNAWTYSLAFGLSAKNQRDERHWYLLGGDTPNQNPILSGVALPEKQVLTQIDATQIPDESLIKPGMQINLQVNLAANSPTHPNLITEVTNNFRAGMEKNGFQVGAGGPYSFLISTSQSNPGGSMEFKPLAGGTGPSTTVPITDVLCDVSLQGNGQTLWKSSLTMTNKTFGIQLLKDGEDISTSLNRQLWDSVAIYLKSFPVPSQVFGDAAGKGLGRSRFVPGGTKFGL